QSWIFRGVARLSTTMFMASVPRFRNHVHECMVVELYQGFSNAGLSAWQIPLQSFDNAPMRHLSWISGGCHNRPPPAFQHFSRNHSAASAATAKTWADG
ncbi:hypothetical protein RZS08_17820, partial [Arthrospira platensis SPKY1]|nr:hypothetical protein [Arthrospira platensis SPKY1]